MSEEKILVLFDAALIAAIGLNVWYCLTGFMDENVGMPILNGDADIIYADDSRDDENILIVTFKANPQNIPT